ncbi:MAG: hypothetical protein J0L84_16535 [Verrucomicrobia bacterium]|nr:hypothetical protein [Verrucomicrobiota bacterium]
MTRIAWWIGLLCPVVAFGQGTVNLNNNFVVPGTGAMAFVLGGDCLPMAGARGRVQVLDGQGIVISPNLDGLGVPFVADGLFDLGILTIPGSQPGGTTGVIIRAWDSSTGLTWDAATVRGTRIVTLTGLGGGTVPPPSLAEAGNFRGIVTSPDSCIPEPGTWALAAAGAVVTMWVLRGRGARSRG